MKFRFAALRINSIDMKMTMMLRRVRTPATPIIKSKAPIVRNFDRSGCCAFSQAVARWPLIASWNKKPKAGVKSFSISNCVTCSSYRFTVNVRQFRVVCRLFLEDLRVNIIDRSLLLERSREHDRTNDCHQQEHTRYFEWQRAIAVQTATHSFSVLC